MSCPALTRIRFCDEARVLALELSNCGRLVPDWGRLAADLRYLCIRGRLGFALDEIARAAALEHLWAEPLSGRSADLGPLLRALPHLSGVSLIDLKAKAEIVAQVKAINDAHGHGASLTARPPTHILDSEPAPLESK